MLIEDLIFYFSHRTLHTKYFYSSIHKIHHEMKTSFCLAALHAHPIEYIFGNVIPMMIGPAILGHRMHRVSMFGWYFIRILEGIDGHGGYNFPWSPFRILPFQPGPSYHFFHHLGNVGNYSSFFTWWDTIFGTNSVFHK
jgi:sterol desaturase/sphingolipid hydroxylase (fatty acid hydroxylase superfamily)